LFGWFWFSLVGACPSRLFVFVLSIPRMRDVHAIWMWVLVPFSVHGSLFLLMFCSREPVPSACTCTTFVLLVSSLYCKLVLLFLIYTILTFDQKKKDQASFIYIYIYIFRQEQNKIKNLGVYADFD